MRTRLWSMFIGALISVGCKGTERNVSGVNDAGAQTDAGSSADAGETDAGQGDAGQGDAGTWSASLSAAKTGGTSIGGTTYASSTKLLVSWTAASGTIDHYEVTATDAIQSTKVTASATGTQTTLTGLKADTEYAVTAKACQNSACTQAIVASASASARTERETWQIVGTGNSFATAKPIIANGNTKPYAFRYGADAGGGLEGKVQLYYDTYPTDGGGKGVMLAISDGGVTDVTSASSFIAVPGYGLHSPDNINPNPSLYVIATSQAVPLSAGMGGKVRLFFELVEPSVPKHLRYLDSRDGHVGRDFNAGASTACDQADYTADGGCAPQTAIGIVSDDAGWAKIDIANQSKMGYPLLTDWRWDGAPGGAFMAISAGLSSDCWSANGGLPEGVVYALWDGTAWKVQYDANGCPKITAGQAPMPLHLGGVKYKMYYRGPATTDAGNPPPVVETDRPMKMIYADGALTGDGGVVEFEDWEAVANARDIDYLWPDGTAVSLASESGLDDFVMLYPTGSPDLQMMYTNMANESFGPIIGAAVLINP